MATPSSPATQSDERDGPGVLRIRSALTCGRDALRLVTAALAAAVERSAVRATRHATALWCLALLVLATDVLLTAYGLQNGYVETNPLAAAMFRQVGVPATFAVLKGFPLAVAGVGRAVLPPEFRGVVPLCLAVPWTAATAINVFVLSGFLG